MKHSCSLRLVMTGLLSTILFIASGSPASAYTDPVLRQNARKLGEIHSRLSRACAPECMRTTGAQTYTSKGGAVCRKAGDAVAQAMDLWDHAMLMQTKGNFMTAGMEKKKARKILLKQQRHCPGTAQAVKDQFFNRPPVQYMTMEGNTNFYGRDYTHLNGLTMDECREACRKDNRCKAYTWVKPGVQGPASFCWLKHSVPPKSRDTNCVSGLKLLAY